MAYRNGLCYVGKFIHHASFAVEATFICCEGIFRNNESFVATRYAFKAHFYLAPNNRSISEWVENFCQKGTVLPKSPTTHVPSIVTNETVNRVRRIKCRTFNT